MNDELIYKLIELSNENSRKSDSINVTITNFIVSGNKITITIELNECTFTKLKNKNRKLSYKFKHSSGFFSGPGWVDYDSYSKDIEIENFYGEAYENNYGFSDSIQKLNYIVTYIIPSLDKLPYWALYNYKETDMSFVDYLKQINEDIDNIEDCSISDDTNIINEELLICKLMGIERNQLIYNGLGHPIVQIEVGSNRKEYMTAKQLESYLNKADVISD